MVNIKTNIENSLAAKHPEIAKQWHPTKNGNLTPYDVMAGCNKKVWWKCPVADDHEWETTANKRTQGRKCPFCSNKKACLDNCFATHCPHLIQEWSSKNEKTPYDYLSKSEKVVWWLGKCGHEWDASIADREKGCNCPFCAGKRICLDNCLATKFPYLIAEWSSKNEKTPYDYFSGTNKKVLWICDQGHEWLSAISDRTFGTNCPICKESKGEKRIRRYLITNNIYFVPQFTFKDCKNIRCLPFDFRVNLCNNFYLIEYQGEQHYRPMRWKHFDNESIKKRDQIKKDYCLRNNIDLLIIPYWDFDHIEEILWRKNYEFMATTDNIRNFVRK